jgi:AMP-polyphosphate phosphotransferase
MLRETSIATAPWYVVEGVDERYRMLTIGKILLNAMRQVNAGSKPPPPAAVAPPPSVIGNVALIRSLDLTQRLDEKTYERELLKYQAKLSALTRHKRFRSRALVLALEGADAAGKGGAIRRVTGALDARQYVLIPVAAPTEEERAQPYLWRFWRHVPSNSGITIFDRTWYGRVLVERVEGYCSVADWMRAYDEINQFEEQLVNAGIIVCKFWLQISKAEQLRRFQARAKTAFKLFKITPEDWRNRKKWGTYEQAVADMVDRTSTEIAPWTLVEAEDKRFGRVKIMKTIVRTLERALD